MTVNIGVLGEQRKVKRIYVSIDGKARRVTKAYTTRSAGYSGARKVFSDTAPLQITATGAWGNKAPVLYAAIRNKSTGAVSVRGTFESSGSYCAMTINADGTATVDHSVASIYLGDAAKNPIYSMKSSYRTSEAIMTFAAATYASTFSIHRRYIVSGNPYVYDDTDVAFKAWTTNQSTPVSLAIGDIGFSAVRAPWRDDYRPLVDVSFLARGTSSSMVILAGYMQGSAYNGSKTISGYTPRPESSMVYYPHDSLYSRRTLAIKESDGKPYLVTTRSGAGSGSSGTIGAWVAGEYQIPVASGYTGANVTMGKALQAQTTDIEGTTKGAAYFGTLSYETADTRCGMLFVDYNTLIGGTETQEYDVVTYVDSVSKGSNSASENWYLLGVQYPTNYVYVLSTLGGSIKIIKFTTSEGQIRKVSEYDTGINLDGNTVLQEPVPLVFNTVESEQFEPAFVLTINNEYNKIVIVPKDII